MFPGPREPLVLLVVLALVSRGAARQEDLRTGGVPAAPQPIQPITLVSLDDRYVNDDQGEVAAADIADGSLTGADVSTTGGDVTFGGAATVRARKGLFGLSCSASGLAATVSGGGYNSAAGRSSTVSGGGSLFGGNSAGGDFSTVGGGYGNHATSYYSTVAGGRNCRAADVESALGGGHFNRAFGKAAVIAGGSGNFISVSGWRGTIAGGEYNSVSDSFSNVTGGQYNQAAGYAASVSGGQFNLAAGDFSFAAGRAAIASHVGSFVWADSTLNPKSSSAADQFNVYASGGTRIFSNAAATSGVVLAPGGGSWSSISDREAKENIDPVDGEDVLERLTQVPIATWNYRAQDESIRHMGPMAQDLHAAFGLGPDPKTIDTIDADGVALAAIQGLDRRLDRLLEAVREQQRLIDAQTSRIESLARANEELHARLKQLETEPAAGEDQALAPGAR